MVTHWRVLPLQSKEVTSSSGLAGHSSYAAYDEGLQVDIAWPQRVTHQKGSSESAAWNFTVILCFQKCYQHAFAAWCINLIILFFSTLQRDSSLVVFSRYWPFGQDGCAYHGFQGMIAVLASISFMAAIAWDRYHQYCTSEYNVLAVLTQ